MGRGILEHGVGELMRREREFNDVSASRRLPAHFSPSHSTVRLPLVLGASIV
nr:hypothetical protein [Natrinema soli]